MILPPGTSTSTAITKAPPRRSERKSQPTLIIDPQPEKLIAKQVTPKQPVINNRKWYDNPFAGAVIGVVTGIVINQLWQKIK